MGFSKLHSDCFKRDDGLSISSGVFLENNDEGLVGCAIVFVESIDAHQKNEPNKSAPTKPSDSPYNKTPK